MPNRIITLFIAGLLLIGCSLKKRQLAILFDKPYDLEIGSKVYNNGLEIGEVTRIDIDGDKILTTINLDDDYKIPVASEFIASRPLIGATSIDIRCSNNSHFLSLGDTVSGQFTAAQLLDTLVEDSVKREKARQSLHKIAEGVSELVQLAKDSGNKK